MWRQLVFFARGCCLDLISYKVFSYHTKHAEEPKKLYMSIGSYLLWSKMHGFYWKCGLAVLEQQWIWALLARKLKMSEVTWHNAEKQGPLLSARELWRWKHRKPPSVMVQGQGKRTKCGSMCMGRLQTGTMTVLTLVVGSVAQRCWSH